MHYFIKRSTFLMFYMILRGGGAEGEEGGNANAKRKIS